MWQQSPYLVPMFAAGIASLLFTFVILFRKKAAGSTAFGVLFVFITVWIFSQTFLLGSVTLDQKVFWNRVRLTGASCAPVMWLWFTLVYTGRMKKPRYAILALLFAIPLLTIGFSFFDTVGIPIFWSDWGIIRGNPTDALKSAATKAGIVYWINTGYNYAVVLASLVILVLSIRKAGKTYKQQISLLIVAIFIPLTVSLAFHFKNILPHMNEILMTASFVVTQAIIVYLMAKDGFLNLAPYFRDAVFENMRDLVIIIDENYRIFDINPAASEFLGSAGSLLGKTASEALPFLSNIFELYDKQDGTLPVIPLEKDKETRYFDLRFSSLPKQNQTSSGLIVFLHDITDRKIAEDKADSERKIRTEQERLLIQQTKLAAMGEMLGAIAHQWRQPLNALALLLQDMEDAYKYGEIDGNYLDKNVHKAMSQIQFLSKTIDDFRNFFRQDKEKSLFNVKEVIYELLNLISIQFKNYNIVVQVEFHMKKSGGMYYGKRIFDNVFETSDSLDTDLIVEGYPNEFKQVILNIITNAKDAIIESQTQGALGEKGKIRFKIYNDAKNIVIEISDNGKGIPDDIIDRIFEPYFTTKDEHLGTGIGLYMSKVIIENNMNGSLTASSDAEGAHFLIKLKKSPQSRSFR